MTFVIDSKKHHNTKHGYLVGGRVKCEYRSWLNMRGRCENRNDTNWKNYGGRGITVRKEWNNFENFLRDMGNRPKKGMSLDRIDNNGNYCKENCRWATRKQQHANMRRNIVYKGEIATEASRRLGGRRQLVAFRVTIMGWDKERAFTQPLMRIHKKRKSV